ncbi:choline transporter-like 2, partial [Phymastichus coffea]|uniref:choline transporter-like 2 n=1 Tax=Phymastichus coffea TaxID=108790 RepID=UPI00273C5913
CSLTVYSFQQVGYKTICIIIQESCKAMVCHPSSILIVTIYFALIVLVNYFIAIVTLRILAISKYEINDSSKFIDPPKNVLFLLFTFIGCSCWIIAVIYNIQRVTLYGIFSTWYQTADKTKISCTISIKMMYTIFRYHFGTLTFGSTIFTIIPIIRIIFNSRTDLYRKFKANKNTIFCYLVILVNATSNTFVTCVSHGTGYYHSMQDSFKLLMQHPLKFVTIRIITELLIFFGAVLIPGLTLFFAYQYILPDTDTDGITIIVIATVLFSITFIFLQSFHAATTAVLHCFLEDLNFKTNESDCNENISVVNDDA